MSLSHSQLLALRNSLMDTPVLSVYVDGDVHDPAQRNAWRQALRDAIDAVHESLEHAPREERQAFARCLAALDTALQPIEAAVRAPGWVAFVTADGVKFAARLPTPMPTLVRWQRGIWAAPCIRALKQEEPVLVVLLDNHAAVLHRYVAGEATQLRAMHADAPGGHADHLSSPPRLGFHPGTRGADASQELERAMLHARERMLHEMILRMRPLMDRETSIVIGGVPEAAKVALDQLVAEFGERVTIDPELHIRATEAEIASAAQRGAEMLRSRKDATLVGELLDEAGAHALGVAGARETLTALRLHEVRELMLTLRFLAERPDDAELAVQSALDQDAAIEIVTGEAAVPLDRAGGIGALLRFLVAGGAPVAAAGAMEG